MAEIPQAKRVDMSNLEVFHFEEAKGHNFEDFGHDNGFRYWLASDLAVCLGYESFQSFRSGPLNKAMGICASLAIPMEENFVSFINGGKADFKLSRFGCYLTAMSGDDKKPRVQQARAFFAALAVSFQQYFEDANNIERLVVRDDITNHERAISGLAQKAGVTSFPLFQNAGYRGLYNMDLNKLKTYKAMPTNGKSKSLLDYMGSTELAANLFRITQTEQKIKNEGITGQRNLERAAEDAGRAVRRTMLEISRQRPENLPLETDIQDARANLKKTHKGFKGIKEAPKKKLLPPKP